jgi:hypothetical protein
VIVEDSLTNTSAVSAISITTTVGTAAAPDLQSASDTGSSNSDNITADNTPTFDLTSLTSGAQITVTATPASGSPVTCTFVASSSTGSCTFSPTLPNGTYSVDVTQRINGIDSVASTALTGLVINASTVATPSTPDLVTASDTGNSSTDNVTGDNTPTISVGGTFAGIAVVTATKAGSTSVSCTLSSPSCSLATLADGQWSVTVTDTDSAGNTATSTPLLLTVKTTQPTVSTVRSSSSNRSYKTGETITVLVNFNESVTVTGTPQLTLETGANDRVVNYASGSGSSTLAFIYTVQAGDTSADLNYLSTTALSLNSGTITDIAGNNSINTLPATSSGDSLGGSKAIVVDTTAPTVTAVRSTNADGRYVAGQTITIEVAMSETVTVAGTPQLSLLINGQNRLVNYQSGSGSSTLTYSCVVQPGDQSTKLEYSSTSALTLNGGSIVDGAGNAAQLTLATIGTTGSLSNSSNIIIDAVAPTVLSAVVASNGQSITLALSETLSATSAASTAFFSSRKDSNDIIYFMLLDIMFIY